MEQEIDFYSIALAKLLQTAPDLGAYILSFKDVSEELNETSDIKVGVFILRVGQDVFFIPVISKLENVYPIDSIFIQSVSKFVPLTKKTIDMVIASSKLDQGKGSKIPKEAVPNPDVTTMINPPRTGKFSYASQSRLGDFLASMPGYLKDFAFEKIAAERSVYENLHKLFAIRDIFAALKSAPGGAAAVTNLAPISIVTTATPDLDQGAINNILSKGYHVSGANPTSRIVVTEENYDNHKFTQVSALDGNTDYELVLRSSATREAFIPKRLNINSPIRLRDVNRSVRAGQSSVAFFTNGDYAIGDSFVAVGERLDRVNTLDGLFKNTPPVLPKDIEVGDTFALFDTEAELLGVYHANRVTLSNLGVTISADVLGGMDEGYVTINAFRNYGGAPTVNEHDLYIPYSFLAIRLGTDITGDLEISINRAAKHSQFKELSMLGEQINLGYDNVEFTINGSPVGSEAAVMTKLAVEEGIDPVLAENFIKQAKERKFAKLYLSKKASTDFKPAEIPQFGEIPAKQGKPSLNGSFMPSVQTSLQTNDAQTVEATIISELLQTPDMFELIAEYMPDIAECLDKLGRVLFLSRVHIEQLSQNNDVDSVFAFLASLKATYRMLGDNYAKLQEILALKPEAKK